MNDLAAVYGTLPTRHVIPNGRNVTGIEPATLRQRVVVTAGRLWDEAKNAALVARAAPAIRGRVVLIGPGELPGVQTLGALPQTAVLRRLSRAAVYAEPARYEPFGLAALEAALCGCALILGDIPSLREVWSDAAVYVDPDDAQQLAAVANHLLADPAQWAARARQRAQRYAPEATADAYYDAYRSLLRLPVSA
jgi:glycosyltransferase involved in cell wall biosynthesis